jgi:hypothetical protein
MSFELMFNTILSDAGIEPEQVLLARHQDRGPNGSTAFSLFHRSKKDFEDYQRHMSERRFRRDYLASFVVPPKEVGISGNRALFIGLYQVRGFKLTNKNWKDPLKEKIFKRGELYRYDLKPDKRLDLYSQRITIEWGKGTLSWIQRADKKSKAIIEIKEASKDEPFLGYLEFFKQLNDLKEPRYKAWREKLKEHRGIYLLSFANDSQYIGSATGLKGFWQRWADYLKTGHGGNRILKKEDLDARNAQITILEVSSSTSLRNEILEREQLWKNKLGRGVSLLGDK